MIGCSVLALYLVLRASYSSAQQDAIFSQYMVNPFVLNPAYAGSRDAISVLLINRQQWLGINGAPQTASLSVNAPVTQRMGAGLQVISDRIGPKNSLAYLGSYSYKIPFSKSSLAFGLRLGAFTYNFDWGAIDYKDKDDVYNSGQVVNGTSFNADFGMFYYTNLSYIGVSGNHIATSFKSTAVNLDGAEEYLKTHLFATAGRTFELNDVVAVQPSVLVKAVENAPVNIDCNLNLLFNRRFWIGGSFRPKTSVVLLMQAYLTDKFRIGYSYDWGLNRIGQQGRATHELFIGYDFTRKNTKTLHPRYF